MLLLILLLQIMELDGIISFMVKTGIKQLDTKNVVKLVVKMKEKCNRQLISFQRVAPISNIRLFHLKGRIFDSNIQILPQEQLFSMAILPKLTLTNLVIRKYHQSIQMNLLLQSQKITMEYQRHCHSQPKISISMPNHSTQLMKCDKIWRWRPFSIIRKKYMKTMDSQMLHSLSYSVLNHPPLVLKTIKLLWLTISSIQFNFNKILQQRKHGSLLLLPMQTFKVLSIGKTDGYIKDQLPHHHAIPKYTGTYLPQFIQLSKSILINSKNNYLKELLRAILIQNLVLLVITETLKLSTAKMLCMFLNQERPQLLKKRRRIPFLSS